MDQISMPNSFWRFTVTWHRDLPSRGWLNTSLLGADFIWWIDLRQVCITRMQSLFWLYICHFVAPCCLTHVSRARFDTSSWIRPLTSPVFWQRTKALYKVLEKDVDLSYNISVPMKENFHFCFITMLRITQTLHANSVSCSTNFM